MYSKFWAVVINSVFGVCAVYSLLVIQFSLFSRFVAESNFILKFSLYNIIWLMLDIAYNIARYHRQSSGLFFWISIILPPVLEILIMLGVIIIFF